MKRKSALRLITGAGLGTILAPSKVFGASSSLQQPNILFIMTDDHDEDAISAYGSNLIETPQIDRLANEGMMFNNAYVTNSLCAPSRATILTGKYSHKNGVKKNEGGFDGTQQTVQKLLQDAGYYTGLVGKWHLGTTPIGFDYWIHLPWQGRYDDPRFYEKGKSDLITINGYATDIIGDLTIETIDKAQQSGKPFFIMSHHKASHGPFKPADRHENAFDGKRVPIPETLYDYYSSKTPPAHHGRLGNTNEKRWNNYQNFMNPYLETVLGIDENVGKVLNYLDNQGLAENTVVIYTTDNGYFLGDHGYLDKRFMYEDSIQIPLIIRYPEEIPAGTENDDIVLNLDFPETFLDYAGASIPDDMQGRSLRPLLSGEKVSDWRESMYYHFYEVDGPGNVAKHYGVRTERYKLLFYYDIHDTPDSVDYWEMYDLGKDPFEMHNIYNVGEYETVQRELKRELKRLRTKYEDSTGKAVQSTATDLEEPKTRPGEIKLHQNTPNPFNPYTIITYELPSASLVTLAVYNSAGRKVETLVSEKQSPGRYSVRFDADGFSSGIYFYKLKAGEQVHTKKMTLME